MNQLTTMTKQPPITSEFWSKPNWKNQLYNYCIHPVGSIGSNLDDDNDHFGDIVDFSPAINIITALPHHHQIEAIVWLCQRPCWRPGLRRTLWIEYLVEHQMDGGRCEDLEMAIIDAQVAMLARIYAHVIVRGPWPEAEPIIMTDQAEIYNYARHTLRRRWPEAEPHLAHTGLNAQLYWFYIKDILTESTSLGH